MGGYGEIIAAAVSIAASAVGTGMSMYSQQQQAQTQERMAAYNAAVQRQNADVQARMAQYQAGVNQQVAMAQYDAQQKNAAALENQARGVEAQGREQARRMREEQERMLAMQRAKFAKAGVVNEGSPLVVLAESAGLGELNIQDAAYETDLRRTELLHKAEQERFQAGFSLLDAGLEGYKSRIADVQRRMAYREADMTRLAGNAQAASYRMGMGASLMSGLSDIGQTGMSAAYYSGKTQKPIPASLGGAYANSVPGYTKIG